MTIGRYPAVSIEQARAKAKTIIAAFAAGKSQKKTKPTEAEVLTLTAALQNYVDDVRAARERLRREAAFDKSLPRNCAACTMKGAYSRSRKPSPACTMR